MKYPLSLDSCKPSERDAAAGGRAVDKVAQAAFQAGIKEEESWLRAAQTAPLTPDSLQTPGLGRGSEFLWHDYH